MKIYNYSLMEKDIKRLQRIYPETEIGSIGKSVLGRELYYIRLGHGRDVISYNGAHHGMEWLTSAMLMKFADNFLSSVQKKTCIGGVKAGLLAKKTSLYIIPMVNPDGVELATGGECCRSTSRINPSGDFAGWQANARGVDLNHNYDAMWAESKRLEREYGINGPGPTRYSGTAPFSEPESSALADFTIKMDFKMAIAFHSQGKVIYQGFMGKEPAVSMKIAKAFECVSPYRVDKTEGMASYGGYKDWFVDRFRRPGFTVEIGEGRNPLPIENLPIIYRETLPIMVGAMML